MLTQTSITEDNARLLFGRILRLERWAVVGLHAVYNMMQQSDVQVKVQELLHHLLTTNRLQMVWLDRIGQHSVVHWKLDRRLALLERSYSHLTGMMFFEEIHRLSQQLLDDINEL